MVALRRTSRLIVLGLRCSTLAMLRSERPSRLSTDRVYRSDSVSWWYMRDRLLPEKSLPVCQLTSLSLGGVGVALTLLTCGGLTMRSSRSRYVPPSTWQV